MPIANPTPRPDVRDSGPTTGPRVVRERAADFAEGAIDTRRAGGCQGPELLSPTRPVSHSPVGKIAHIQFSARRAPTEKPEDQMGLRV